MLFGLDLRGGQTLADLPSGGGYLQSYLPKDLNL